MVNMEIINDAELLANLAIRYKKNLIFTYVGPTLLAVNPF
jgi:myosin heavy subunit